MKLLYIQHLIVLPQEQVLPQSHQQALSFLMILSISVGLSLLLKETGLLIL